MVDIGKLLSKNIADIDKILGVDTSTLAKLHGLDIPNVGVIPAGLIVPYWSAGAAPAGFTAFTSAANRMIIGAWGSLPVGTTGGSNTLALTVSGSGTHGGNDLVVGGGGTGPVCDYNPLTTGNHSHTATAYLYPPERYMQLMTVDSDLTEFPAWMTAFSMSDLSLTMTQYFSGEYRLFGAKSGAQGTQGSWTPGNVWTTYAGTHHHVGNSGYVAPDPYAGFNYNVYNNAGNNRHLLTMSAATNNIYRTRMTAWSKNTTFELVPGMIFLYNNITPPAGWALCDGSSGTPNLNSRLLELGTTGNHGTIYGTGQITANWSEGNHANHHHYTPYQRTMSYQCPHATSKPHANSHGSSQVKSFYPPYYALAFIMYTG